MSALFPYLPILLKASLLTLSLALLSLLVATFLGAIAASAKLSTSRIARENAQIYTTIIRGIPELVLLLLVYYGLQSLINGAAAWLGMERIELSAFWAGVLALGFIFGAYMAETFRGAYMAIPAGQGEAARALGLSPLIGFFKVILPQLIRHAIPSYSNVFQVLIKATAIVGVIGLSDLVGIANDAGKTAREPFIFLLFVLLMYLIFYYLVGIVFDWLSQRFAVHEH